MAALLAVLALVEIAGFAPAFARGGAANLMNSPGYQRRLQESRGTVAVESNGPRAVVVPHRSGIIGGAELRSAIADQAAGIGQSAVNFER
jgi:hypothetical protein